MHGNIGSKRLRPIFLGPVFSFGFNFPLCEKIKKSEKNVSKPRSVLAGFLPRSVNFDPNFTLKF